MQTLVPPPVVAGMVALLMWLTDAALPRARFELPLREAVVAMLAGLGLALMLCAVWAFRRARTTVNPLHPDRSTSLITGGVFALSRNPIYLGDVLLLAAWAIWLGNAASLSLVAVFVAWMTLLQIRAEEAALRARFGADFERYCRGVRRWI
ncbi:MAG: isoprenylcysteine carboxylmethyltransferase family protein [Zoogloeaceae bacterium]|nr:isoprenylcysteine carboxylmethyltransferase family protein [Zoogloeaceae bacterium]